MVSKDNNIEKPLEDKAGEAKAQEESSAPHLPTEFYQKLLRLPPCKTGGECNNCGRCER